jgi:hypothetical protein
VNAGWNMDLSKQVILAVVNRRRRLFACACILAGLKRPSDLI